MRRVAGIDVGGTFTDLLLYEAGPEGSRVQLAKIPTTNAVLERKVAKVGLVTTRGFRDTLDLGRRTRPNPYGMTGTFEPLIPRERRIEIDERMNVAGEIVTPLAEEQLADAVRALLA